MSEALGPYGDLYRLIYAQGMAGEKPSIPVEIAELERQAQAALDPGPYAYVFGGAGTEDTIRANVGAFAKWRIVPRMLRDITERDLRRTVLSTELPAPLMVAPVGVQTIVHPDGDLATARAAAAVGLPMVASTVSGYSLEDIAKAGGDAPRWFQLYWPDDDDLTASMVGRAERAGYEAIVVTVDNCFPGWKPRDLQEAWLPFLHNIGTANFQEDPVFLAGLEKPPEDDLFLAIGTQLNVFVHPTLTWEKLERLRAWTKLPILLKGILHPDDAREAHRRGVDGLIVSNHGGRQVDGAIAALDALPAIVEAVGSDLAVLFDSGIRTGADAVKAIALGAEAVLVGRPFLWGLALEGQSGVEAVLRYMLAEMDLTMALSGVPRVDDVERSLLVPAK